MGPVKSPSNTVVFFLFRVNFIEGLEGSPKMVGLGWFGYVVFGGNMVHQRN